MADEWSDNEEGAKVNQSGGKSYGDMTSSFSAFNFGDKKKVCRKCNEEGHLARDCPSGGGNSSYDRPKSCFKCKQEGHFSRECPNADSNDGGYDKPKTCFKCKQEGHFSRECPNADSNDGGYDKPKTCFKCKQEGHFSRECPNADSNDGGFDKPKTCFKCKEEGHFSRECPNADSNDGGFDKPKTCFKCRGEGHFASDCTEEGSSSACFKCKEEGHMARECPNQPDDPDKPKAQTYIPEEVSEEDLFSQGVVAGSNFSKYDNIPVESSGTDIPPPVAKFLDCGLRSLLLANIAKARYLKPTPIQKHSLPIIMKGRDIMACAQTGSGKTAAFLLPILNYMLENNIESHSYDELVKPAALIMSPTRELAIQIFNEARKFSISSVLKISIAYGGTAVGHQHKTMQKGCHVLVATPGRLWDFVEKGRISFECLNFLVLDEADRMLDLGFAETIKKVVNHSSTPKSDVRQTLMFSATFPSEVQEMAKEYLKPEYIFTVVGIVGAANADVKQIVQSVAECDKRETLLSFLLEHIEKNAEDKILVFVKTKKMADFIACYLSTQKVSSTSIHGDRFQNQREEALAQFKNGVRNVLVATAVAARGLDIKGIGMVVNYDMPDEIDEYVHRIGRTGRVGNQGVAISYFDVDSNSGLAKDLVKILSDAEQDVPDWLTTCANSSFGGGSSFGKKGFGARDIRGSFKGKDSEDSAAQAFGGPAPAANNGLDEEDW